MSQKFHRGDHVQIADNLGPSMSHFQHGTDAIVIGSYRDQYGGSADGHADSIYTVFLKGRGQCSWYWENQLTLLEADRGDLLKLWQDELAERDAKESDLDWIFDPRNREEMLHNPPHASIRGLAACLLITEDDLWGSHGEGTVYWENAMRLRAHAKPYLERSSKPDWLKYCEELMQRASKPSH